MNIDSAKKKLIDGRATLAKAGDDPDLLAVALTKIHAALEDACRFWLFNANVAEDRQLDVQNRNQVSWKELLELMAEYCQWSSNDVEYVRRWNNLRNRAAHGDDLTVTREDIEEYAIYVENLLNRQQLLSRNNISKQSFEVTEAKPPANILVAYALWGLGLFGFNGVHRLYLGKPVTGLIWLFSYGFLCIGQVADLFLIPSMVKGHNSYARTISRQRSLPVLNIVQQVLGKLDRLDRKLQQKLFKPGKADSDMLKLLEVAQANGKVLSIGQAVMMTGLEPREVQDLLDEALRAGLAHIENDLESGAVRYRFDI